MRHKKETIKLGRTSSERKHMARLLASSLVLHEKVQTTAPKARFIRPYIDKVISVAKKENKVVAKRGVHEMLLNAEAEKKLRKDIVARYKDRNSGYTRTIKVKNRKGDGALVVQIELV